MMFDAFGDFISLYVKFLQSCFRFVRVRFRGVRLGPFVFELKKRATSTYEATLEKIERTRDHLQDAILAVDTLQTEIRTKKDELDGVLSSIRAKQDEKENIDQKRAISRRLLSEDSDKLKDALGFCELRESRADKIVGFIGGVVASLAAAGIWALVVYLA